MRSTATYGLLYQGGEAALKLTMYVDASYRSEEYCPCGYVAVLGGAAVSCWARRQKQPSDSSCAAEFRKVQLAAKETVWLRFLLEFLHCKQDAVTLACDSKSAIQLMTSVAVHRKSEDLCRDLPLLRDLVTCGEISPQHIAGEDQPACFLTKSPSIPAFNRCRAKVGLTDQLPKESSNLTQKSSLHCNIVSTTAPQLPLASPCLTVPSAPAQLRNLPRTTPAQLHVAICMCVFDCVLAGQTPKLCPGSVFGHVSTMLKPD